jgi:hypothetical protein
MAFTLPAPNSDSSTAPIALAVMQRTQGIRDASTLPQSEEERTSRYGSFESSSPHARTTIPTTSKTTNAKYGKTARWIRSAKSDPGCSLRIESWHRQGQRQAKVEHAKGASCIDATPLARAPCTAAAASTRGDRPASSGVVAPRLRSVHCCAGKRHQ